MNLESECTQGNNLHPKESKEKKRKKGRKKKEESNGREWKVN